MQCFVYEKQNQFWWMLDPNFNTLNKINKKLIIFLFQQFHFCAHIILFLIIMIVIIIYTCIY